MSFLDKITARDVLYAGLMAVVIADAALLWPAHPWKSAVIIAAVAGCIVLDVSFVRNLVSRLLNGFAQIPAWPRFVLLGVVVLLAALTGGWRGAAVDALALVALAGNFFRALY